MKLKTILIIMCLSISIIPIVLIIAIQGFGTSLVFLILIFIVTFCFSLLVSHLITRPIIGLTKNLDDISKGQLNVKLERSEIYEINDLTDSLDRIMASLKLAIYKFDVKKGELFNDDPKEIMEKKQDNIPNVDFSDQKIAQEKTRNINKKISNLKTKLNDLQNKRKYKSYKTKSSDKEKFYDNLSEQKDDYFFIFDSNAKILDCNENISKTLGYSKEEMLSLNMTNFDLLETKQDLSKKINTAKKNGTYCFKTIFKRKDGSTFLVFENLQYIKDKDTFKCIVRKD